MVSLSYSSPIFKFEILFLNNIYVLSVLDLSCCSFTEVHRRSSCGLQALLFFVDSRPHCMGASPVVEHRL